MKKIYNAAFLLNVIFQAFFNLLFPMALMFFVGRLAVSKLSFGQWTYAVFLILGLILGLVSMIKFLIYALDAFEKTERAQKTEKRSKESRDE